MPLLLHAPGIGRGAEIDLPLTELEAWGTGGFAAAVWLFRSGEHNNAGNITPVVMPNDGAGNATGAGLGLGANSNSGGAAVSRCSMDRNTTGTPLNYLGTGTGLNGNEGNIWFNQWVGYCISCDADVTVTPTALYYNCQQSRYDWCLGYRGAVPSGTWTATGSGLWLCRSTYWGVPGAVAFVQLWNRSLTQGEMYRALTLPGSVRNGLTLYLPLDHDLRDEGPLGRHGRYNPMGDQYGNMKGVIRFPSLSDGSGFGNIPRCPVRGVRGLPIRIAEVEAEAPTVPDGRTVLAGDDFTGTDGTALTAHTPSGPDAKAGTSWLPQPQASAKLTINGNGVLPQADSGSIFDAVLDGV